MRALDRASRSVLDGARLLEEGGDAGVRVLSCDGYDSADEETQFTGNIKIAVAQEERRLISRRTREGLARARAEGKTLGRQSIVHPHVMYRIWEARGRDESYASIAAGLDSDGIPTPGGSAKWRPAAVRDIYRRTTVEEIERLASEFDKTPPRRRSGKAHRPEVAEETCEGMWPPDSPNRTEAAA